MTKNIDYLLITLLFIWISLYFVLCTLMWCSFILLNWSCLQLIDYLGSSVIVLYYLPANLRHIFSILNILTINFMNICTYFDYLNFYLLHLPANYVSCDWIVEQLITAQNHCFQNLTDHRIVSVLGWWYTWSRYCIHSQQVTRSTPWLYQKATGFRNDVRWTCSHFSGALDMSV